MTTRTTRSTLQTRPSPFCAPANIEWTLAQTDRRPTSRCAAALEVTTGGQAYEVAGGQQSTFQGIDEVDYGADSLPDPIILTTGAPSAITEKTAMSARYVSREVIGYDDLDANGTWRVDPAYGPVWVPTGVAAG